MTTIQHPATGQTVTVPEPVIESYIADGWQRPGQAASPAPTTDWTNAQIRTYARRHDIALHGARAKAAMLAAIAASKVDADV